MRGEQFRTTSIASLLSLVLGIRRWLYRHRSGLGRSLKHAMICSRLGTNSQQRRNTEPGLWCGIVMASVRQLVFANFLRMLIEGAYLSFLWISPELVGSVVWSQACECVAKSLFHLFKWLLLCGNAQIIGVQ